ncbi:molecular chaperone TorD [Psychromonas sp. MB-3u-54]|uniref:molecular chaperone TorD n=1 Tax=Psychromonas sp. MB-3u-54 TaxID=2058319 RepID=UPI000C34560C|nr:molecular chaperone TorD [Psychromonas sp. MB-3u-54]PKH02235.1 molecular chaperone TorD [Psychromonas sp. MB-3u-54]
MNDKRLYDTAMNQGRSMVYKLLSSLFAKELDHQLLKELTASQAQAFLAQLASDPLFIQDIATLNSVLNSTLNNVNTDHALLELAADYCGLFLVGTKHSASPYASLYLKENAPNKDVLLFGEQHQQMQTYLQQSQLTVQSEFPEPADHIAVILAYVAHQACASDDKTQLAFINQYLNAWLGSFTDKVTSLDTGKFYAALAHLTQTWVASDCEGLAADQ